MSLEVPFGSRIPPSMCSLNASFPYLGPKSEAVEEASNQARMQE